jgi:phosphoesterase RecJ-like protein
LAHINPDPDTIGCALAIYNLLRDNYRCEVVCLDRDLPRKVNFLRGYDRIKHTLSEKSDVIIACDSGSLERLGLERKPCFLINIDHHQTNTLYGDINVVDPNAPSTGCVVYRFLDDNGFKLNRHSAEALYAAIVEDSKYFTTDRVSQETFQITAALCEEGVDPSAVADKLRRREPLSKLRLKAHAYSSLDLQLDAQIGFVTIVEEDLKKSGAAFNDYKDIIEDILSLYPVEVAVLLIEKDVMNLKVSLRSKRIDVASIALRKGGGGHIRAAGYEVGGEDILSLINDHKSMLKEEIAEKLL